MSNEVDVIDDIFNTKGLDDRTFGWQMAKAIVEKCKREEKYSESESGGKMNFNTDAIEDKVLLESIATVVGSVMQGSKRCEVELPTDIAVLAYRCGTVLRIDIKGLPELNGK